MGKVHLLTIVACPGVPEPASLESEPDVVESEVVDPEVVDPEVVLPELLGGVVGGPDGWFLEYGAENVVRAKKPMVIKAVVADLKERMMGNGL